jgi:hypothetical protein
MAVSLRGFALSVLEPIRNTVLAPHFRFKPGNAPE